jgi:rod shape-determining protein MreC
MVEGDDVEEGDVVLTSGIDGIYPKGLKVGKILKVGRDKESLVQLAQISPSVDFGRMEQVFVMEKRGPTMNLLYDDPANLKSGVQRDQGVQ